MKVPTSPSVERSSGTKPTPLARISRVRSPTSSCPSRRAEPLTCSSSPTRAWVSSVCPLPCTPATARISPGATSKSTLSSSTTPLSPTTVSPRTSSAVPVVWAVSLATVRETSRPTIRAASSSVDVSGPTWPTTSPRRITVITSDTARTSRSLWEMNTMDVPLSRSCRMISSSSSVSRGVSTAVGSSRINTLASRTRALMISTRCWTPTGRSSTTASGSTAKP